MSSLDPITMATQFATLDVQPFQQQNQKQATQFQTQLGAVGKVENALREFRSAIDAINKDNQSVIQNSVHSLMTVIYQRPQQQKHYQDATKFLSSRSQPLTKYL